MSILLEESAKVGDGFNDEGMGGSIGSVPSIPLFTQSSSIYLLPAYRLLLRSLTSSLWHLSHSPYHGGHTAPHLEHRPSSVPLAAMPIDPRR